MTVYVKRTVEKHIKRLIRDFRIIFITGPRQSGKTTLVKHLFKDFKYYNLETPTTLMLAQKDPLEILSHDKVILDEAQEAPWLFSYLLEIVDKEPQKRVIIAGSQNLLLHHRISQSLAGRVAIAELLPFAIEELTKAPFKILQADVDEIILKGFYPAVYTIASENVKEWYLGYIKTYIERDIRTLRNIKDLTLFQDFMALLAGQAGGLLNLTAISNNLGVSVATLREWLSLLEASYIIFRLRPFSPNLRKRFIKTPKLYFYDTGLLTTLLGIKNLKELKTYPLYGQIFENFVVSEIFKSFIHHKQEKRLYFVRDKTGNELDLIWHTNHQTLSVLEIKSSKTFNDDFVSKIEYYKKILPIKKSFIIYKGEDLAFKGTQILNWKALAEPQRLV